MSSDFLFGGTPLISVHFKSDLAKTVFNDKGRVLVPGTLRLQVEDRTMNWLFSASPKSIMRWSRQIDTIVVPLLSPPAFRSFCCFLCEHQPQALDNMPNTRDSVQSLARAVNLSRVINSAALDRIHSALIKEGLL